MSLAVTAITASGTNAVARAAKVRTYLGIFNQSATATVYVAFDTAATAAATAGQITLLPISGANKSCVEFYGPEAPNGAVNIIASASSTPVTVID